MADASQQLQGPEAQKLESASRSREKLPGQAGRPEWMLDGIPRRIEQCAIAISLVATTVNQMRRDVRSLALAIVPTRGF